ncbi:hypothetical protein DL546_004682 [Coniochaeta pulveracea]|uniref:Fungal lipase-type domain-containing protein n=1 Tax=Coniochaeta pulveracea TaxID=177199 RepID=A0A420Y074_9PEZI|nr:hypothetical protein DL546_004682 [Coniochaeta pulveracea]
MAPRSAPCRSSDRTKGAGKKPTYKTRSSKERATTVAASAVSSTCFAKVSLYANSRLPRDLPALRLYVPTFPLLCLAAQFSERAYERPRGAERETHFDADWRNGTKAMVIKSVPMDYMNTIVFAIRGTATFMDWVVNLNTAPASPRGFLDDPGNLCHAGFLSVARRMIRPVAARLRQLLEEEPGRASYSLLITGHSAGGAIASLLYSHLLSVSEGAESELNILAGCFRRIHCVTFGTPPVSLLPLTKPDRPELKKSLFLSFVNEGDPVVRADLAYVRSLLLLYASPSPPVVTRTTPVKRSGHEKSAKISGSRPDRGLYSQSVGQPPKRASGRSATAPIWKVPPCVLSNAGRIVVLRSGDAKAQCMGKKTVQERLNEGVVAQIATDEQLRTQVWGDPMCHLMKLYAGRIETLAVAAVTLLPIVGGIIAP